MTTHTTPLHELAELDRAVTRVHGDCAIRIGRHVQEAEFQGRAVNADTEADQR